MAKLFWAKLFFSKKEESNGKDIVTTVK